MRSLTPQNDKELREFGLGLALLIALIFWGLLPWLGDRPRPAWPLAAGAVLGMAALAWPVAIYPIYRVLLPVARVVGVINTWLLLGAVFFGMLLPIGWVLRLLGRLQYQTRFDPGAATYRIAVDPHREVHLEEPF
jgi:hypothetical protein